MIQNPSTELVASGDAAQPTAKKAKRIAQMAGAAALSFGLVGTFSLPAYATAPESQGLPDGFAAAQSLETPLVEETIVPIAAPEGAISAEAIEQERQQKEAEEAAKRAEELKTQTSSSSFSGKDIPAGVGAQGIVNAALAQLGVMQDCTALVEKSLRAVGIPAGDLGTQIGEYTGLGGTLVTSGDYAPGDVLIWSGRHVAVYIGNGQAVHGGFQGNQTVVASAFLDGAPSGVVRFG
ncbi:NlpC/P60 family protein [Leucobacter chironomi]|uniref:NlpC/P60 family protein n=1 Tax=Leucobacter chironomi TaxID=491918 RepID=UPI0004189631|nr:NlpC/P60 family protein [Leucobacter chironomi]